MAVFLVSYDLKVGYGSHDYEDLEDAIDLLDAHKVLQSVYLISTDMSAEALGKHLARHIDPPDRLWVSQVLDGGHWYRALKGTTEWLEARLPR